VDYFGFSEFCFSNSLYTQTDFGVGQKVYGSKFLKCQALVLNRRKQIHIKQMNHQTNFA